MRFMLATLVALGFVAGSAQAQAPGRPAGPAARTPGFSPYLNLLRRGNSTALNYYGIVRPEVNALKQFNSLQGQIQDNRRAITDQSAATNAELPGTGDKAVMFLNTGGYFMNLNPAGSGTGGSFGSLSPGGGGGFMGGQQQNSSRPSSSPPSRRR